MSQPEAERLEFKEAKNNFHFERLATFRRKNEFWAEGRAGMSRKKPEGTKSPADKSAGP